jgi:hypothetical protein
MIFLQACPDTTYFHWQLWAQMLNFRRFGIEQDAVICLAYKDKPSEEGLKFQRWTKARVEFFKDERKPTPYASSVRPHVIKKLFQKESFPCVFYHDSDIIFLERPDIEGLSAGDTNYVGGTAKGYLDWNYLNQHPKYIMYGMFEIIGITEQQVQTIDSQMGGAQYVLKNTDFAYWEACEWKMDAVYRWFEYCTTKGMTEYNPNAPVRQHNIQKWATDMWIIPYETTLRGGQIRHHDHLNFAWPFTDSRESVKRYYIAHNAGITAENKICNRTGKPHLFYKGEFHSRFPWGENFDYVKGDTMSYLYTQYIKEAELHYKTA